MLAGVVGALFTLDMSAVRSRDGELQNLDAVAPRRLTFGLYVSLIYVDVFFACLSMASSARAWCQG